jgi:uncharacterized membrane protein HdeD (DUF308 family)
MRVFQIRRIEQHGHNSIGLGKIQTHKLFTNVHYFQEGEDEMTTMEATVEPVIYPWWAVLVQGIFSLLVGILLLTNPLATTLVIIQFIGIYWLVGGVFSLVGLFIDRRLWGLKLISGILGILAGLAIMQHPLWSTILLPSILVIYMGVNGLIMGSVGLFGAFRGGGWGAGILGALSLLFGLLLLGAPVITGLALPWVFGLLGVIGGIASIIAAFMQRGVEEAV